MFCGDKGLTLTLTLTLTLIGRRKQPPLETSHGPGRRRGGRHGQHRRRVTNASCCAHADVSSGMGLPGGRGGPTGGFEGGSRARAPGRGICRCMYVCIYIYIIVLHIWRPCENSERSTGGKDERNLGISARCTFFECRRSEGQWRSPFAVSPQVGLSVAPSQLRPLAAWESCFPTSLEDPTSTLTRTS